MSHTFFVTLNRDKSIEIEKELNSKIRALQKVLDDFANPKPEYDIPKHPVWTRKQLAAKLNAKDKSQATDEELLGGIQQSLKVFKDRIEKDFSEDKKELTVNMETHNDLKLRKKKVEEMAGALHLWTGTSGKKIGGVMGAFADDRYDGSRAFARYLIGKQCSNEG